MIGKWLRVFSGKEIQPPPVEVAPQMEICAPVELPAHGSIQNCAGCGSNSQYWGLSFHCKEDDIPGVWRGVPAHLVRKCSCCGYQWREEPFNPKNIQDE